MGTYEASAYLGVGRVRWNNLQNLVKTPFPEPLRRLRAGGLWDQDDLRAYALANRHLLPEDAPALWPETDPEL